MNKQNLLLILTLIFTLLVVLGCAKIVAPTGGQKDTTPPKILGAKPEIGEKNYSSKELEIEFDEYVKINNTNDILVSPFTKEQPEYILKGKKLLIRFPDELQKDITYSIDFKNNIKDINEGNALSNFKYSFSTGETMDSTSISGTAKDALTKEVIEKCIVGLYKQNTDTSFIKTPPLYFTVTDENGNYRIDNIKEGSYELVSLIDQNGNFFFDLPNETIAFSNTDLELKKDSTNKYDLFLFLEQNFPKLTTSNEYNKGKVKVEISEKINNLETKILSPSLTDSIYEYILPNLQEINYFYNFTSTDTALIEISGDNLKDTIKLISKSAYKPDEIKIVSTVARGFQTIDSTETLNLKFTNCIQLIEEEKINLYRKDSLTNTKVDFSITQNINELNVDSEWKPNKNFILEIPPETITDIFNQTNADTLKSTFKINNSSSKGSLTVQIKQDTINAFQYLYELRNKKDDIIAEGILQDTLLQIPDLTTTDSYKFKTIQDSNSNSKWDTGNYLEKRQPEIIKQYEQEISIKKDFETEIKIDLNGFE